METSWNDGWQPYTNPRARSGHLGKAERRDGQAFCAFSPQSHLLSWHWCRKSGTCPDQQGQCPTTMTTEVQKTGKRDKCYWAQDSNPTPEVGNERSAWGHCPHHAVQSHSPYSRAQGCLPMANVKETQPAAEEAIWDLRHFFFPRNLSLPLRFCLKDQIRHSTQTKLDI